MVSFNFYVVAPIEKCITEGFIVKDKRQPVVSLLKADEVTVKDEAFRIVHAIINQTIQQLHMQQGSLRRNSLVSNY